MKRLEKTSHRNVRIKEDVANYLIDLANKNGLSFSAQLNFMLKQQMNLELDEKSK
jgi:hypothetical protein